MTEFDAIVVEEGAPDVVVTVRPQPVVRAMIVAELRGEAVTWAPGEEAFAIGEGVRDEVRVALARKGKALQCVFIPGGEPRFERRLVELEPGSHHHAVAAIRAIGGRILFQEEEPRPPVDHSSGSQW